MERNDYPLASLCIFFYNQESFVADTVAGALSQTYPNCEIILSDDCSTDNTFEAIQESVKGYKGPHKIVVNKNEVNIGLVPHINKVLFGMANGEYIFLNGGDDISLPQRVNIGVSYYKKYPDITAVTFSNIVIDKNGREIKRKQLNGDSFLSITDREYLISPFFMTGGAALSFNRVVLDKFGQLSNDCQTEDSVLRFRSLLMGKTLRSAEFGLKYRMHDNNLSRKIYKLKTELIAQQYRKDLDLIKSELPAKLYDVLCRKIEFYIKYRNIQAKGSRFNVLGRVYNKWKKHLLESKYREEILKGLDNY